MGKDIGGEGGDGDEHEMVYRDWKQGTAEDILSRPQAPNFHRLRRTTWVVIVLDVFVNCIPPLLFLLLLIIVLPLSSLLLAGLLLGPILILPSLAVIFLFRSTLQSRPNLGAIRDVNIWQCSAILHFSLVVLGCAAIEVKDGFPDNEWIILLLNLVARLICFYAAIQWKSELVKQTTQNMEVITV